MGRKKYNYDYIVIGSGPAGSAAALTLAQTKKRIALVEGRFYGGANLNSRDVPYAIALDFANTFLKVSSAPEFKHQDLSFNLPTIISHELKSIISAGGNNKEIFEKAGITCIHGYANFLDNHTIAIGDQQITSDFFILATGASLKHREISGTETVNFLTPERAIKVRRLPKAILIAGGGATGCEIAQYFASLGTKVILMETAERLLPREDQEVSETISSYFTNQLGILVLPNCKVVALEQDQTSKRVIFHNGQTERMVRVDCIILATGSQPRLDYGLENAGIKYKHSGIIVDKYFQTSAKNIYAIGDATGSDSSTDRAHYEGILLATNLANKAKNLPNYQGFGRFVATTPGVVTIGLNEDDLLKRDRKYKKAIVYLADTPAGKIYDYSYGFVKLLADKSNHLIGATVVAPDANLIIAELAMAIRHNLSIAELASTPHSTNSCNYMVKLAAKKLINK